ncbi:MAG: hypothetical protein K0R72_705 [Clostridia bacterium]|jgi:hypothetical protein|nr:hypothetical protein [Clostridia bacterium]
MKGLYNRDYLEGLTEDEEKEYNELLKKEIVNEIKPNLVIRKNLYFEYPKAARHYNSLFPNNFLDICDIRNVENLLIMQKKFEEVINNNKSTERDVLNFINNNKYYPIIGSILKDYHFGHHGTYLFKEFPLGTTHQADYLLIGDSSEGHHLVFVELESINGQITTKDGNFSISINKGIDQVREWKTWIEANYQNFRETFNKYKLNNVALPNELSAYNSNRIHYVVISGRRTDYTQKTYDLRMEFRKSNDIKILHYDNLITYIDWLNTSNKDLINY